MAHFALLDEKNIVTQVIFVKNENCLDNDGNESEQIGIAYCKSLLDGNWVQTSYSSSFRKNYAGIGYLYDETTDSFIPPQPFKSWTLNAESMTWEPPAPKPTDGYWVWNEKNTTWEQPETNQETE